MKSIPLRHAFVEVGFDAGRGRVSSISEEGVVCAVAVSFLLRRDVVRSTFANGGRSVVGWCSDHAALVRRRTLHEDPAGMFVSPFAGSVSLRRHRVVLSEELKEHALEHSLVVWLEALVL